MGRRTEASRVYKEVQTATMLPVVDESR
jgi:hypothetical protein